MPTDRGLSIGFGLGDGAAPGLACAGSDRKTAPARRPGLSPLHSTRNRAPQSRRGVFESEPRNGRFAPDH